MSSSPRLRSGVVSVALIAGCAVASFGVLSTELGRTAAPASHHTRVSTASDTPDTTAWPSSDPGNGPTPTPGA